MALCTSSALYQARLSMPQVRAMHLTEAFFTNSCVGRRGTIACAREIFVEASPRWPPAARLDFRRIRNLPSTCEPSGLPQHGKMRLEQKELRALIHHARQQIA